MKLVIIESPYAGDIERNMKYLHRCVLDCLSRGESPYASHAFFTQFLDDNDEFQRSLGINAGLAWSQICDNIVVYEDYGMSEGMRTSVEQHCKNNKNVEFRTIGKNK